MTPPVASAVDVPVMPDDDYGTTFIFGGPDEPPAPPDLEDPPDPPEPEPVAATALAAPQAIEPELVPVSYTHLTLPTILRV